MRKISILLFSLLFITASAFAAEVEKKELDIPKDKVSYSVGYESGRNFRRNQVEIDVDLFVKGLKAGLEGQKPAYSEKEMRKVLNNFQAELRKKMAANRREAASINKTRELEFLAENKKKPGVKVTSSGVQYAVVVEGKGKKPTDTDFIDCNYRLTLIDGSEFDKSEEGKTTSIKVSQLVPGWKEVAKMMAEGSRWQVVIPARLGYGERGVGSEIGPNTTLLLDLEIVSVKQKPD